MRNVEQTRDTCNQLARLDRFGEVHLVSRKYGPLAILGTGVGCHGNGRYVSDMLRLTQPDLLDEFVSIVVRHPDVAHENVNRTRMQQLQGFLTTLRANGTGPALLDNPGDE